MIDQLNKAINDYKAKWQAYVGARDDAAFFTALKPTAVAWKTEDLADFNTRFNELRDQCDRIVLKWMNERWVAKMHLKDTALTDGITIIKLMQRRPNSTDPIGLDHLDFYTKAAIEDAVKKDAGIKWSWEENGNCKWISVWFDGTEAKLRNNTVLDVTIDDLKELEQHIIPGDA